MKQNSLATVYICGHRIVKTSYAALIKRNCVQVEQMGDKRYGSFQPSGNLKLGEDKQESVSYKNW